MRAENVFLKIMLGAYLVIFFGYLLGPLIVMSITAFNSPSFPKMTPWECLTFEWFDVLANDTRILNGIENSLIVGVGTVILSVIMGLAAALLLTQIWPKLRATYYTVVIAPILIPGVVLGISTLVFWDRISVMLGMSTGSILHNGIFLTILGQSTFIASYCMLVFVARLQRFNTTTFTFGKFPTLTIELAQKVRYGINPSISSLAFIIIALTIFGALIHEVYRRHQQLALANGAPVSAVSGRVQLPRILRGNPAAIILILLALGGFSTIWFAQTYSPDVCKMDVREQKRLIQEERIRAIREQRQLEMQQKQQGSGASGGSTSAPSATQSPGQGAFGNVFKPDNLDRSTTEPKVDKPAQSPGKGAFGDVFAPNNLDKAAPKEE